MATVAEELWRDHKERYARYVRDFVNAERGSIDESVHVLNARLSGLGFKGADLRTEITMAILAQKEKRNVKA